jgi:hypothetical protein
VKARNKYIEPNIFASFFSKFFLNVLLYKKYLVLCEHKRMLVSMWSSSSTWTNWIIFQKLDDFFCKIRKYQRSWKSIQRFFSCSLLSDRRADRRPAGTWFALSKIANAPDKLTDTLLCLEGDLDPLQLVCWPPKAVAWPLGRVREVILHLNLENEESVRHTDKELSEVGRLWWLLCIQPSNHSYRRPWLTAYSLLVNSQRLNLI